MSRMVSRPRSREGRGLGEKLSESMVFIVIAVGIVLAARWYFVVYLRSPGYALGNYIGAMGRGKTDEQFELLAAETKKRYGSEREYRRKWQLSNGISARLKDYKIGEFKLNGETAEADVVIDVQQSGQKLYEAGSKSFSDHYVMQREGGKWKVDLIKSKIDSLKAADISAGMPL